MENGLQANEKIARNDYTLRGTENPNSRPVEEGMELATKCLLTAAMEKNSLGGVTDLIVAPNKETEPATDNEGSQHQKENSPGGAQELDIQEASLPSKENKQSELLREENRKANLKVKLEFGTSEVLLGFSELLCIKFLPKNSVDEHILKALTILGSLALISGFCLQMHTLFMLAPRPSKTPAGPIHDTISKFFVIMSCTTLVLASLPLLLLPKPYNFLIPIVLAAVLLTLGAHLYLKLKTSEENSIKDQTVLNDEQMKEITRLSELSQVVMSLSSGGLTGLLFGIHKNSSNHAHPFALATVFLTFTSFMFSTSLMFLFQMRLVHLSSDTRKLFLRIGGGFCKFLLVLLAFVALVITFKFLKVYTVMICVPFLVVYLVWQSIDSCRSDPYNIQDTLQEEELKLAYTKGNKVASVSFGGIMAIFSGYLGSVEKNMHLNICIIFMASAFLSGLCLMLLSYKPSTRSNIGLVVNILSYVAMNLLAFGALAIFILEFV